MSGETYRAWKADREARLAGVGRFRAALADGRLPSIEDCKHANAELDVLVSQVADLKVELRESEREAQRGARDAYDEGWFKGRRDGGEGW